MRARLARYKQPGMSYEDVIAALLDRVPVEVFRASQQRAREAARAVAAATEPAATGSPAERMEQAFRLSQLMGKPGGTPPDSPP